MIGAMRNDGCKGGAKANDSIFQYLRFPGSTFILQAVQ